MARLRFPKGLCSISVDGKQYAVGKDGIAEVPATAVPELIDSLGAKAVEEKAAPSPTPTPTPSPTPTPTPTPSPST